MNSLSNSPAEKYVYVYDCNTKEEKYYRYTGTKEKLRCIVKAAQQVGFYLESGMLLHYSCLYRQAFQKNNAPQDEGKNKSLKKETYDKLLDENKNCEINIVALIDSADIDVKEVRQADASVEFSEACLETLQNKRKKEKIKRTVPQLLMIAGHPGSGKSTIGKRISKEVGACFIDKDTAGRIGSDEIVKIMNSYDGDRETNAFGAIARRAEYLDMGYIAKVNLELNKVVTLSSPFTAQVHTCFDRDAPISGLYFEEPDEKQDKEIYLGKENANSAGQKVFEMKTLIVWVKTSMHKDRQRLEERAATRDVWKLSHFIHHMKLNEDIAAGKQETATFFCFDNEHDDNFEHQMGRFIDSYELFRKTGRNTTICCQKDAFVSKDGGKAEPNIEGMVQFEGERLDELFADDKLIGQEKSDDGNSDEKGSFELEKWQGKDNLQKYFYSRNGKDFPTFANALYVADIGSIDKEWLENFAKIQNNYKEIYFSGCEFSDRFQIKKCDADIEFDHCIFHGGIRLFNRRNTEINAISNNIIFYGCEIEKGLRIQDYRISEIMIQQSVMDSLWIDNCRIEKSFTFFEGRADRVNINNNCGFNDSRGRASVNIEFRESTVTEYIEIPEQLTFRQLQFMDNTISLYLIPDMVIRKTKDTREYIKEYNRKNEGDYNTLTRKIVFLNDLYKSYSDQNRYIAADGCFLMSRRIQSTRCGSEKSTNKRRDTDQRSDKKNPIAVFFSRLVRFWIPDLFGSGVSLLALFLNLVATRILSLGVIALILRFSGCWESNFTYLKKIVYWDFMQFFNIGGIGKTLIDLNLLDSGTIYFDLMTAWSVVISIYGIIFIAFFTGSIVRRMIR